MAHRQSNEIARPKSFDDLKSVLANFGVKRTETGADDNPTYAFEKPDNFSVMPKLIQESLEKFEEQLNLINQTEYELYPPLHLAAILLDCIMEGCHEENMNDEFLADSTKPTSFDRQKMTPLVIYGGAGIGKSKLRLVLKNACPNTHVIDEWNGDISNLKSGDVAISNAEPHYDSRILTLTIDEHSPENSLYLGQFMLRAKTIDDRLNTKHFYSLVINDQARSGNIATQDTRRKKIHRYSITDPSTLDDLLLCLASTIEDGILQAGGNNTEYTVAELFKLAQPFALETYKKGNADFTVGYPG